MSSDASLIKNARIVLADRVITCGVVSVRNGLIEFIEEGPTSVTGTDLAGDLLIPGLVELHTDHLEPHIMPRPKVDWHPESAVLAYDAQIATSGITTVFDSLRVGADERTGFSALGNQLAHVIHSVREQDLFRAEHLTHLRCEICSPDVVSELEKFLSELPVQLISLMDHTPGQRQFRDLEKLRVYYRGKSGMTEEEIQAFFDQRQNLFERHAVAHRRALVELAKAHDKKLASHDDTTLAQVEESVRDGVVLAEFPTTNEAAVASHKAGVAVMMGAPNLVRGGSHSGNVSAKELAEAGVLDILSSDYVPASLLQAAFSLPHEVETITLPEALAAVTRTPARTMGLDDRGEIAPGKRADLVHVQMSGDIPVVRQVWREGRRVA